MRRIILLIKKVIHSYINSELIKVSAKNSLQVLVKLITGLLSIKIISVFLGASGMALLSQFYNVIQFGTNMANGGIMHGVTKLTAHFDYSKAKQKLIVHNALIITIVLTTIPTLFLFLFGNKIAFTLFYDIKYAAVVRASGVLIFTTAINNLLLAFCSGLQVYNKYIYLNIINGITSFLIAVPAIYFYRMQGALWSLYIASLATSAITFCFIHKYLPSFRRLVYSKVISKRLINFGLMLLVASSLTPLEQIITRNVVVEYCSLSQAGWWDGIGKISNTYISIIITTLSLYVLPKISKTLGVKALHSVIQLSLKQILPLVALGSLLIYLLRDSIISILFTYEFIGMRDLFLYQAIGDVLRVTAWFFAITIMMKEQVKQYIFAEVLIAVIAIVNAYLIIPRIGIVGSTLAYAINMFIYFIFVVIIYRRMLNKDSLK
ncbi:polysaccharide transporter, PST family [Saccharicrinis carchari]|uniref:Polysaccharide transporter, PST family n=1 Tax=Saccharicrinis carchari TaxID=1168039 RepID=A0A521CEI6_SACCC|nr:O-antigen translocase [Saccharicrinis carchari]SMO57847.1 polysaccharide transporter, PST family [Saccharicrinis carchari]